MIKNKNVIKISSSLKFCELAESKAVFYPRFSSISKWDIAAGHAILNASGGRILSLNCKEFKYDSSEIKTKPFFAISDIKYKKIVFGYYKELMGY